MQQEWQNFLVNYPISDVINAHKFSLCLLDLACLGILEVSGEDAKTFLQGQLTCNLNEITPIRSQLGAHCNLKGRTEFIFRIFQITQNEKTSYCLTMPLAIVPYAHQALKKFALFSKVTLEDISARFINIGLYGAKATEQLSEFFQTSIEIQSEECAHLNIAGNSYILCRLPDLTPRYEIYATTLAMKSLWLSLCKNCTITASQLWELLDIQTGIPTIYPTTIDLFLPHHLNLSILKGISYNKGCYLGQEIIARMHYRGKIKKHMYRVLVNNPQPLPLPGDAVYTQNMPENEAPGHIVRVSVVENKTYELLVVFEDKNLEDKVCLYTRDGPLLSFLSLPYPILNS